MRSALASFCCVLLLQACAGSHTAGPGDAAAHPDRNLITAEELAASQANNVLEAVSRLRPHFVRPISDTRYAGRMIYPDVIMDGMDFRDGVPGLRGVPLDGVRAIRYYSVYDARVRFGIEHRAGVISIVTVASPRDAKP